MIVFDDADIASVVSGVRTFGYYNAGQDCTAACRIYAGAKVYERVVADLAAAAAKDAVAEIERAGGVEVVHGAYFDTLTTRVPGRAAEVVEAARERGVNLRLVDADRVGIACDETTTR